MVWANREISLYKDKGLGIPCNLSTFIFRYSLRTIMCQLDITLHISFPWSEKFTKFKPLKLRPPLSLGLHINGHLTQEIFVVPFTPPYKNLLCSQAISFYNFNPLLPALVLGYHSLGHIVS